MEPIISPWLIYLLSISQGVKDIFFILIITGILTIGITVIVIFASEFDIITDNPKRFLRYITWLAISFTLVNLFYLFVPSRNTLIGMIVADQITYDAVGKTVETGKAVKDELKKDVLDIIEAITKEKKEK